MNAYEQKQQNRRERFEARAEKAEQASTAAWEASRRAVDGIVMGQPILVGHHSESRHRGALARSDRAMRKSCDESAKAKHYAEKAAAVGTGGISSDDPDALDKLRAELASVDGQPGSAVNGGKQGDPRRQDARQANPGAGRPGLQRNRCTADHRAGLRRACRLPGLCTEQQQRQRRPDQKAHSGAGATPRP